MKRTPLIPELNAFPSRFRPLLENVPVWDSSCSPEAQVWFIEKDTGLYLKSAPTGTLESEAKQTSFFYEKGLGPQLLAYETLDQDWLLTCRIPGEDCTHAQYLEDPKRLAELLGTRLRMLHDLPTQGCPVTNHTTQYLDTVWRNYAAGCCDTSGHYGFTSAEEAIGIAREYAPYLQTDTLLHGDYCLPNIMLDQWNFSGFIDLGRGGIGDRHVDLFWGVWSLQFNLKTDIWGSRFLDAYGREKINPELLQAIGAFEVFG